MKEEDSKAHASAGIGAGYRIDFGNDLPYFRARSKQRAVSAMRCENCGWPIPLIDFRPPFCYDHGTQWERGRLLRGALMRTNTHRSRFQCGDQRGFGAAGCSPFVPCWRFPISEFLLKCSRRTGDDLLAG